MPVVGFFFFFPYEEPRNRVNVLMTMGSFGYQGGNITRKTKHRRGRGCERTVSRPAGDDRADPRLPAAATVATCRPVARGDPAQERHSHSHYFKHVSPLGGGGQDLARSKKTHSESPETAPRFGIPPVPVQNTQH